MSNHSGLQTRSFFLIVFFFLLATRNTLSAQAVLLSATPKIAFPITSSDIFDIEAGVSLNVQVDPLFEKFEGMGRLGYSSLVINEGLGNVSVLRVELGGIYPFIKNERFSFGPFLLSGGYGAFREGENALYNPIIEAGIRAEIKFGNLRLAIEPGAEYLFAKRDGAIEPFFTSAGVAVSFAFNPVTTSHRPLLRITNPDLEPFFPVIYKFYSGNSLGKANIMNKERSTVTNIAVTFFVPAYMDGPQTLHTISTLKAGESADLPIMALFKNNVLGITETDTAQARIQVKYSMGKENYTIDWDGTINIQGRNAILWNDDRIAAAFVTARDPTILKLARNTVANMPNDGLFIPSESIKNAAILFQSLELYGLKYVVDPKGSYATMKGTLSTVDYLQFPVETLTYRSGDCDDLTTLYLAMLESVGIETAFITVPGHIYAAFALDKNLQSTKGTFADLDKLIFAEDKIWVPVETTALGKGFAEAWALGARQWKEAERQHAAALIRIHDAWRTYEPSFISSTEKQDVVAKFADPSVISVAYTAMMNSLASRELSAMIAVAGGGVSTNKQTPQIKNRLGSIYARYGMMDKAEAAFKDASVTGYTPALFNLGNIQFMRKEYLVAADFYKKVLVKQPSNADATLSLSRSLFEAGRFDEASKAYGEAKQIAPEKAEGFTYLAGGASQTASRASDSMTRYSVDWIQ